MIFALYLVSLAGSAAVVGAFGRDVLAEFGFVAGFQTGVLLTAAFGFAYAATQCAFMTLLRFLEPTRSRVPYFTESLSHASVLALLPYMADVEVAWPHDALYRVEPLIFLAAFGLLHLLFKMTSFYASLQGELGSRWSPLAWLGASAACAVASYIGVMRWTNATEGAIPEATRGDTQFFRVGDQYARGIELAEGSVHAWEAPELEQQSLTLRWALPPSDESGVDIDTVYATFELYGDERKDYHAEASVSADGWTSMHVPASAFPANMTSGRMRWAREETPSWQRLLGISPVVYGEARESGAAAVRPAMIMSGVFTHQFRAEGVQDNIVIVLVDGLSADRLSFYGYGERITPNLDTLAAQSVTFLNAFTPTPDPAAALEALLTGIVPLRRTITETALPASLAELTQADHFATAAFLESRNGDLEPGGGVERGYELVQTAELTESDDPMANSAAVIANASDWIDDHVEEKFFAVLRLRGLMNAMERADTNSGEAYDRAVAEIDAVVGKLILTIREGPARRSTSIIVTAPYGYEPGATDPLRLSDPVVHVPLIMHVPGFGRTARSDTVGLEDMAATMALIAEVTLPRGIDGKHVLSGANGNRPIAAAGDPPTLSVRTEEWRYTWASPGATPAGPTGLFRLNTRGTWWTTDITARDRQRAQRYREELESYLERQRNRQLP